MTAAAPIVVFVSGTGRLLRELHARAASGALHASIDAVVSSRVCPAVEWARQQGISTHVQPGDLSPDELAAILAPIDPAWIVLAGYLRKLPMSPAIAGRVVNIHPALLPAFGGVGMFGHRVHEAVLAAGDTESGCTVHLCDEEYDTGPILAQARCDVRPGDTAEALAARVFTLEKRLLPDTLQRLISGELVAPERSR